MATSYPQFVLLGDSLFNNCIEIQDGFSLQAKLQQLCARRMDVINRGCGGYNTRNLLTYIDHVFPPASASSPKIKYLALLIGANDAVLPYSPTSQHVPIDEYKENLVKIINHPRIKEDKPKILLVTPPPVDELKHAILDREGGYPSTRRTSATTASYAEKVREVVRENPGVVLIDLWKAIMDEAIAMAKDDYQPDGPWLGCPENGKSGGLDTLLPDALHMNGHAYEVFYETIRPHIEKEWEGLPLDSGFVYPHWSSIFGPQAEAKS